MPMRGKASKEGGGSSSSACAAAHGLTQLLHKAAWMACTAADAHMWVTRVPLLHSTPDQWQGFGGSEGFHPGRPPDQGPPES